MHFYSLLLTFIFLQRKLEVISNTLHFLQECFEKQPKPQRYSWSLGKHILPGDVVLKHTKYGTISPHYKDSNRREISSNFLSKVSFSSFLHRFFDLSLWLCFCTLWLPSAVVSGVIVIRKDSLRLSSQWYTSFSLEKLNKTMLLFYEGKLFSGILFIPALSIEPRYWL